MKIVNAKSLFKMLYKKSISIVKTNVFLKTIEINNHKKSLHFADF